MQSRRYLQWFAIPLTLLLSGCHQHSGGSGSSLLALLSLQALNNGFYVDAMNGSDANDGRSPPAAWQTLGRVAAAGIPAGAVVYLRRGGNWNEQLILPSSGITIDAYGNGSLPILDGARDISGWTSIGGGLYSLPVVISAQQGLGNLSENGTMMSFVKWDTDPATTLSAAAIRSYSYDYGTSTLYIKPTGLPGSNAYRASVLLYGIRAESLHDIVVRNVQIQRFSLHGIEFKDCIRCEVHDSAISNGGGATVGTNLYAGNGIEFGNSSSRGVVDGVTVSDIFDSCISPQTYASNQTLSSITISGSQLSRCGFAAVEVSVLNNSGSTGSLIQNVNLSGLAIHDTGKGWSGRRNNSEGHGIRVMAMDGAGSMSGISISTTTVSGAAGDGILIQGETGPVLIQRTAVSNSIGHGISVLAGLNPTTSIKLEMTSSAVYGNSFWGLNFNAPVGGGFRLIQNTFVNNGGVSLGVQGQAGEATIQNNLFYSTVGSHLYAAGSLTGATIDNNCYNDSSNMISYAGPGYNSVADFHAAHAGFEANGSGGPVNLASVPGGDFRLQSSSACRLLGASGLGVSVDFDGYSFASPPSAGAYQFH